jgi:hypothetical protein
VDTNQGFGVKKLESPRKERRSSLRNSSATPEVPSVVIPPPPKAIRDLKKKEKSEKTQKHVRIVEPEVSISVKPNSPPPKRKEKHAVVPDYNSDASSSEEDELSEDDEVVNPVGGKTGRDKDAIPVYAPPLSAKRPFDEVPAVIRPAIPRDHVVSVSSAAGKVRDITPATDTLKLSKGPHKPSELSPMKVDKSASADILSVEERIAERLMKQEVALSQEELLSVSPGVKKALLRKTRNQNVRRKSITSFSQELTSEGVEAMRPEVEMGASYVVHVEDIIELENTYEVLLHDVGNLPAGAVVQKDIVETYRQDLSSEERGKVIIVASMSDSLRSVYPTINRVQEVECILDSGSQIIAMDMMVAVGLGVSWDPDSVIHMQGANGQLKRTKGLARNVPFLFGDLTFYLQLHIIDSAPYQVLLGRPFDVLAESEVLNYADGYQELTIRCPNSGQRSTVGTYPRGQGKRMFQRGTDPVLKDMGRPSEPQNKTEERDEDRSDQRPASVNLVEDAGNFINTLRN